MAATKPNINVVSAAFGVQEMNFPVSFRSSIAGEMVEDSTGIDKYIANTEVVRRKGIIQVGFRDIGDAEAMQLLIGTEASLVLKTRKIDTGVGEDLTQTWALSKLFAVHIDAIHNAPGTHIAEFIARSTNGSAIPIS